MGVGGEKTWLGRQGEEDKVISLCKIPFWQSISSGSSNGGGNTMSTSSLSLSSSSYRTTSRSESYSSHSHDDHKFGSDHHKVGNDHVGVGDQGQSSSFKVSSIAKSLLPPRRRLRLDPSNKLFFPYEPGKQVRSAISIKNICKSHIAFKFQTTEPKSCYMRPPGGILAPGESMVAVVFKFVEPPESKERPLGQKSGVKFKIMSLKVKEDLSEYIPELFEEQKDHVSVEQILRVAFLDAERPSPALEKLKRQLAEADAAVATLRKPQEDALATSAGPQIGGEGLVIDEWKERRERYLAQQLGQGN